MDIKKIEEKWQKLWEQKKVFQVSENSKKNKFYVLEMFPYPSASYLHMGHVRNYTIGDVISRYKRMKGFNVLYPMGYDSFGLPAENAAKKEKKHPKDYTESSIKKIMEYQKQLGNSYDWSRTIATHTPEYYKWNQYFFLKFYEKDLVYRKKAPVNWCPSCKTVLANEEVENGKCWRCDSKVETNNLEQWFFRTTKYADELLKGLEKLDWSERIKSMQRNWIGKSEGIDIFFKLKNSDRVLSAFTPRCDTIFSVTFLAIAPESPLIGELVKSTKYEKTVKDFVKKVLKEKMEDRINEEKEKVGVFTGRYAINPTTKKEIPVYVANFALMYGTGVVMCDAHDKRDFRFARKYKIQLKFVISKDGKKINTDDFDDAFVEEGILFDSGIFSGMNNMEALPKISLWLEQNKMGKRNINYKLKDWLISRQRYWGTPIPIIYCDKCKIVPLKEKDLPLKLPEKVDYKSEGNPLNNVKYWVNVKCPNCKSPAKRETDTMGGFVDSSWYFLRFCSPHNNKEAFDKEEVSYWMPVDQYIGGIEHAVGHLIYSRFFTKVLRDMKILSFDEPFKKLFNQGVIYKDGHKMSKSFGNVVYQTDISGEYGIDTARIFLMSISNPESDMEWSDKGVEGSFRFLQKIQKISELKLGKIDEKGEHKRNLAIKNFTENIEEFKFNMAIIELTKYADYLLENPSKEGYVDLLKMLSPFAPHTAEELWHEIGKKTFVSVEKWPEFDEKKINPKFEEQEKAVEKLIEDINNIVKIVREKGKQVSKAFVYIIPKDFEDYSVNLEQIKKRTGLEIKIFSASDKSKYDPENKSSKAKPGKPGIYLE